MKRFDESQAETAIAWVMRAGVAVSAAVIAAGVIWQMIQGTPPFAMRSLPAPTLRGVLRGILAGDSLALIQVGILLLIVTPWVRVIMTQWLFLQLRDRVYSLVCFALLLMMGAGLLVGGGG